MSPPSSRTALGAALIVLAALAVYGGTVGFAFVFDDHVQIQLNPWLQSPDGPRLLFTRPFWGFYADRGPVPSNYYRPVFGLAYSLVARIWGMQPAAFHAASVLLHAAVSLLVALAARRLFQDDAAALVAGLLFAVYPAHAEAVAWVAGQADLLAALFVLLATLAYFQTPKSKIQNLFGPCAYFLACLAKEPGAALILAFGAVEATEWRRGARAAAARLAPYGLGLAVYVALRVNALGGFAPRHYGVAASPAGAVAFAGALLARYLGFLAMPFPARVLASVPVPSLLSPLALAGLAAAGLAMGALAIAAWSGRARREIVLPLAFLFAFLLPVLAANSIGGANFAERYLYLPSIGLAWLAGLGWRRLPRPHRGVTATALAVLLALGLAAWSRSEIYRSDLALFTEVVRTNPRNEIARNNLGMALYHEGRLDAAEREYRTALRIKPRNVAPLSNLAVLRERQGRAAEAEKLFEQALRISPVHAVAAVHLARAQIARGDRIGAARRLDTLFAAGGESYDALVERAGLWLAEGRAEKALPLLERAVAAFPGRVKGREMLGRARGEMNGRLRPLDLERGRTPLRSP